MASRYWVGGTGSWSDATNHWATTSGGTPGAGNLPTSADDVFFDSASNASGYTVTIDATTKLCKDITFTAPASGDVTLAGSVEIDVYGSLTLYSGLVRTYTGVIRFLSTTTGKTVTTAGVSLASSITFEGVGGGWTLQDALTTNSINLINGALNTNGKNITCVSFSSSNSNVRSLTFISGTITITGNNATVLSLANITNLTFTGGTGTWDFTYSGSVGTRQFNGPGATVALGNIKFSAGTDTVSFAAGSGAINLDFTGFAGTWSNSGAMNLAGNLTVSTGMTVSYTGAITCSATSGTQIITTNGKTLGSSFTLSGSGGTVQLADNLTTTGSFTQSAGTLDPNNKSLTFAGTSTQMLTVANPFLNLSFTGAASKTGTFTLGTNITVTGTLTIAGNSAVNRLLVLSNTKGTARTITVSTTNTLSNVDFKDITGAGTASWNIAAITGLSGDCGGNSGITFTTPSSQYYKIGASANWSTTGNWYLATNGTGGAGHVPLPQDTAVFDANSIIAGSVVITQDMPRIGSVNWTGVANTPTWTTSTACAFFGSITLVSGMTLTSSSQTYTYEGRGSKAITCATKSWGAKVFVMDCVGGTLTLSDAFLSTASFTVTSGNLVTSSTFGMSSFSNVGTTSLGGALTATSSVTTTGSSFISNGYTISATSFNSNSAAVRTVDVTNSTITVTSTSTVVGFATSTNMTFVSTGSTFIVNNATATSKTFAGGGLTFGTVTFSGDNITITGSNTFTVLNVNTAGLTNGLKFTSGTTQTITTTFATNGSAGSLAKILAVTASNPFTVSKSSGTISVDYMNIKDSTATGGASWFAGANSTNSGGNTGWTFTAPGSGPTTIPPSQTMKRGMGLSLGI